VTIVLFSTLLKRLKVVDLVFCPWRVDSSAERVAVFDHITIAARLFFTHASSAGRTIWRAHSTHLTVSDWRRTHTAGIADKASLTIKLVRAGSTGSASEGSLTGFLLCSLAPVGAHERSVAIEVLLTVRIRTQTSLAGVVSTIAEKIRCAVKVVHVVAARLTSCETRTLERRAVAR